MLSLPTVGIKRSDKCGEYTTGPAQMGCRSVAKAAAHFGGCGVRGQVEELETRSLVRRGRRRPAWAFTRAALTRLLLAALQAAGGVRVTGTTRWVSEAIVTLAGQFLLPIKGLASLTCAGSGPVGSEMKQRRVPGPLEALRTLRAWAVSPDLQKERLRRQAGAAPLT